MKTFLALLAIFSALYLTDYALTLAATERAGFRELNPLADYWNTGDNMTPLYLKLLGLAIILPLAAALHRTHAQSALRIIAGASLLLVVINSMSVVQLTL